MTEHILQVSNDAPLWSAQRKSAVKAYLYLLGICNKRLTVAFSLVPATVLREDINWLIDAGYIVRQRGTLVLGEETEKGNILLVNELSPLLGEAQKVDEMVHEYSKKGVKKAFVVENGLLLLSMLNDAKSLHTNQQVMRAWECYYSLIYKFAYRSFTAKEVGQFMHLVKFYGAVYSVKMIIAYLTDANSPNVGELLLKKDKFYHRVLGDTTPSATKNNDEDEEGYFKK